MKISTRPINITPSVLRRIPLPLPDEDGDKEERGRVLVIGGVRETPGALVLAGVAALRAGAGKLQLATVACNAPFIATTIPEARVFALKETKTGKLAKNAHKDLLKHLGGAQCVCIGPGMIEDESVAEFVAGVLSHCGRVPVLLDAGAIASLCENAQLLHALEGRAILTPNAEELSGIFGEAKEKITSAPMKAALRAASELRAVVVLKGRETFIASPEGKVFVNREGSVGLATSGSGDVLAGVVAGLVARGAEPLRAAAWGAYLHARAGERVAAEIGPLGFLARELLSKIPKLMSELAGNVN